MLPKNSLPIMFHYAKETKLKILYGFRTIEKQIKGLKTSTIQIDSVSYYVDFDLLGTTIDGKICQHFTETKSAANCNICGAKPTQTNCLAKIMERKENKEAFKFGAQDLQCWIRIMECVLKIS